MVMRVRLLRGLGTVHRASRSLCFSAFRMYGTEDDDYIVGDLRSARPTQPRVNGSRWSPISSLLLLSLERSLQNLSNVKCVS